MRKRNVHIFVLWSLPKRKKNAFFLHLLKIAACKNTAMAVLLIADFSLCLVHCTVCCDCMERVQR